MAETYLNAIPRGRVTPTRKLRALSIRIKAEREIADSTNEHVEANTLTES
jgi:hypothetical protein